DIALRQSQIHRRRPYRARGVAGQAKALRIDDVEILVDQKFAVAGIKHPAALVRQSEKSLGTVDGDVIFPARDTDVAHREALVDGRHFHAQAYAGTRVHVGERGGGRLEAHRARVGDVVADDVQILRRSVQAAQSLSETHV